ILDQGGRRRDVGQRAQRVLGVPLVLDGVAALRTFGQVHEGAVALVVVEPVVDEVADSLVEMFHAGSPCSRVPSARGAGVSKALASSGARWSSAARSCARPRWMRLRTVPS